MRALLMALTGTAIGLAIAGLSASVLGDRSILVAPPDGRVEGFVRALMAHRPEIAVGFLAAPGRQSIAPSELASRFATIDEELHGVRQIESEAVHIGLDESRVRLTAYGRSGVQLPMDFELRWEHGAWRIVTLPSRMSR